MPPKKGDNKGKAPAHFGSSPRVTRSQAALASSSDGNNDDSAAGPASSPPSSNNNVGGMDNPLAEEMPDNLSRADDEIADVDMDLARPVADLDAQLPDAQLPDAQLPNEQLPDAPVENAPLPLRPAQAGPASSPSDAGGNNSRRPFAMPPNTPVIDLTEAERDEEISGASGDPPHIDLTSTRGSPLSSSSARRRRSRRSASPLQGRSRRVSFRDRTPERRGQGGGVFCGGGLAFRGAGRHIGGVLASGGDGGVGVVAAPGSGGFDGGRMSKANLASDFEDPAIQQKVTKANKAQRVAVDAQNAVIAKARIPPKLRRVFEDIDDTFAEYRDEIAEELGRLVARLVAGVFSKKAKLDKEKDKEKENAVPKREDEGGDDDDDIMEV